MFMLGTCLRIYCAVVSHVVFKLLPFAHRGLHISSTAPCRSVMGDTYIIDEQVGENWRHTRGQFVLSVFSLHHLFLCGRWLYLQHLPILPFNFGFVLLVFFGLFLASLLSSQHKGFDLSSLSTEKTKIKPRFLI